MVIISDKMKKLLICIFLFLTLLGNSTALENSNKEGKTFLILNNESSFCHGVSCRDSKCAGRVQKSLSFVD